MSFEEILAGGDPRSLGKTEEVVKVVLADRTKLKSLFECLWSDDEIVRMRAGDGLEKICSQKPQWFEPFKKRLLSDVPKIRQASIQWHLAQILGEVPLDPKEQKQAIHILLHNLTTLDDWIVTNLTLESLANFARKNEFSKAELLQILNTYKNDSHKSVASRAAKLIREFSAG